jgi:hypothetical protein
VADPEKPVRRYENALRVRVFRNLVAPLIK